VARYRIHQFDADDHVTNTDAIDCTSDDEALQIFRSFRTYDAHAVELWAGSRLIRRLFAASPSPQTSRV
jgi:hypothetical protein